MITWRLLVGVALLAVAAGCGESLIEKFEGMPGAPRAVWTLDFMPSGAPAVLGGPDTFGVKQMFRQRPGEPNVWEPAAAGPQVALAKLFRRGRTLYLGGYGELWRLDDEATFTWSRIAVPSGAYPIGVDGTGRYYGTANNGVVTWAEGFPAWTAMPADGPAKGTGQSVADGEGNVYSTSPQYGISRFHVLGSSRVVDCAAPESGNCGGAGFLTLDGAGNLYFLANGAAQRLRKGTTTVDMLAPLPAEYPYIHQLQAVADGTLFLTTAINNRAGTAWAIFRLKPGDNEFVQITGDDLETFVAVTESERQYVVSDDARTIYGFGDGNFTLGVIRGTL